MRNVYYTPYSQAQVAFHDDLVMPLREPVDIIQRCILVTNAEYHSEQKGRSIDAFCSCELLCLDNK